MAYFIITDIHFIFLRPETPQKNKAKILYLGSIVDFDSFIQQQINSTEEENNDVLVQIKYKENIKAKFNDGELEITLPKKNKNIENSRKIAIE